MNACVGPFVKENSFMMYMEAANVCQGVVAGTTSELAEFRYNLGSEVLGQLRVKERWIKRHAERKIWLLTAKQRLGTRQTERSTAAD